jgi:hypothetical protein
MGLWEQQNQEWNKANEDTLIDRQGMLGELADFKAQSILNNQNIEKTLSDSAETLRNNSKEILDRVRNNFASMGRSVSPYVMASISSRLALQNKDKLDTQRAGLEMDRAQIHGAYLDKLERTLADTKRTTMDPQTVLAMMKELGGGAAGGGVASGGAGFATGGGGSARTSGGGAKPGLVAFQRM